MKEGRGERERQATKEEGGREGNRKEGRKEGIHFPACLAAALVLVN